MDAGLRGTIEWFAQNLDWWLEDRYLAEEKICVDLCFDSIDVSKTIEGIRYYYNGGDGSGHSFDLDEVFKVNALKPLQDNVLVHCLAFSGKLGIFKMLPPHQAELSSVLEHLENNELRHNPHVITRQFLKDACERAEISYDNKALDDLSENELREFVRQYAGSAVNLFKIIQLIRGGMWQKRLGDLHNNGLLLLERPQEKFDEIVDSDDFRKLKAGFDKKRPWLSKNNFADAFAVSLLQARIRKFKAGELNRLPRFFTSSSIFFQVIRETGLEASISYELGNGLRSNPLRQADYFVFQCIFSRSEEVPELRRQVDHILKNPELLSDDTELTSGRPLGDIIKDLNSLSFFENVWRPAVEEQETPQIVNDLREAALLVEKFDDPLFKGEVIESYRIARKELEEKSREYRQINELWQEIEHTAKDLRKQIEATGHDLSFFREFGLVPLGFDKQSRPKIEAILYDLLAAQEVQARHARLIVAIAYHKADNDPTRYLPELSAATAILLVTERYRQLVQFLDRVDPLPHFSLNFCYAAAAFDSDLRDRTNLAPKGLDILTTLRKDYEEHEDPETRAYLAIGIAYVLFRQWLWQGGKVSWREESQSKNSAPRAGLQKTINQAIEYSRGAFHLLENLSALPAADKHELDEKKVYALNQRLYYLVEGGTRQQEPEMHEVASKLIHFNQEPVWQYRFYDTLARYNHRFAMTGSRKKRSKRLQEAQRFMEKASQGAPWDKKIQAYRDRLTQITLANET